jgi:hypothetical protein
VKKTALNITALLLVLIGCQQSYGQADQPPYVSPVPKYTFSETLKKQEQEIKNNPLVKRFAESR